MKKALIFFIVILFGANNLVLNAQKSYKFKFQNPELDFNTRVDDLISRLTLEEKAGLMLYDSPPIERLNIPSYNWWNECLHGVGRAGKATVFPQAIGLAATFDDQLAFEVASAISDEARAKHHAALKKGNREQYTGLTFWTPNINIFRDPRWGRGQETYGEDVLLTSKLGVAFVKGLQGNHPKYLKTSACAKHFAVHSGPEETRHEINVLPNERNMREIYFPAFKALVDGGVETVMCAYNRLKGTPCCGSSFLLNDILRNQWGFKGHIVSDCFAMKDFWQYHKVVKDNIESAALAANAGVNLNCGNTYKQLAKAVKQGLVSNEQLNHILKPLLLTRFKLGMFDPDEMVPFAKVPVSEVNCKEHVELSYKVAAKSMVLLQNNNKVLPINKDQLKRVLVTGPLAADNAALMGNYNGFSGNMVTVLEGIINRVDEGTVVEYSPGCLLAGDNSFHGFWQAGFVEMVIAVVGNNHLLEGEEGDAMLNKNGGDRVDLKLPENQVTFLKKMREAIGEKPLVVVVTGGSAINLSEIEDIADAILFAWYPGEQGGNAAADILFGDVNPSGKLPVTFYKSVNDLPAYDNYSMDGRTYKFFKGEALYPFGFGLSYTEFKLSEAENNLKKIKQTDSLSINCTIKNKGNFDGEEVIQIYAKKVDAKTEHPIKTLIGFKRVAVEKGGQKTVQIAVDLKQLNYWDVKKQKFAMEKGEYLIEVGTSSSTIHFSYSLIIK
jgi:beta-glucosidase